MCRSNCIRSLCHIAIYQETIFFIIFCLVKRMFSSIWLIWKVVAIRFFHRKQCLIVTSFDIVPSASLHLNHFFFFVSQYQKGDFVTKHEQFIQTTHFFFNQSHYAINLLRCLPWWLSHSPDIYHIKANSVSNILHFPERQLHCPYAVENAFVLDILNG